MLLGKTTTKARTYVYGTLTHSGRPFQTTSTSHALDHSAGRRQPPEVIPHNPQYATPARYHTHQV